jgi:hypothetical protein
MIDRILTPEDVQEILHTCYRTALQIMNSIPHFKVGKGVRVYESILKSWIIDKTVYPLAHPGPEPKPKPIIINGTKYLDENGLLPYGKNRPRPPA